MRSHFYFSISFLLVSFWLVHAVHQKNTSENSLFILPIAQLEQKQTCLDDGISQLNSGNYRNAIESFNCAVVLYPNLYFVYLKRAQAYSEIEDYQSTLTNLVQAFEREPLYAEAYLRQSISYHDENYSTMLSTALSQMIESNSENPFLYYINGILHSINVQPAQAISNFNVAIELVPNNDYFYLKRSQVYADLGRYELAIEDTLRAIEINPSFAQAYTNQADYYSEIGESEQFLSRLDLALSDDPNAALPHFGRGYVSLVQRDYESAIEEFDLTLKFAPDLREALVFRSRAYFEIGMFADAAEDLSNALELAPWVPELYSGRGFIYYAAGKRDEAVDDLLEYQRLAGPLADPEIIELISSIRVGDL